MEKYIQQLLTDIQWATDNVQLPWVEKDAYDWDEWKSEEEDRRTAPRRSIESWTGIQKIQLPPHERLTDDLLHRLLIALKKLLDAYNCLVVFLIEVPERLQYEVVRENFDQESSFLMWHMNFFEFCHEGQEHYDCTLGEYCQCGYLAEFFSGFSEDSDSEGFEIDPEEIYLRRKYGDRWHLYYDFDEEDDPDDIY